MTTCLPRGDELMTMSLAMMERNCAGVDPSGMPTPARTMTSLRFCLALRTSAPARNGSSVLRCP